MTLNIFGGKSGTINLAMDFFGTILNLNREISGQDRTKREPMVDDKWRIFVGLRGPANFFPTTKWSIKTHIVRNYFPNLEYKSQEPVSDNGGNYDNITALCMKVIVNKVTSGKGKCWLISVELCSFFLQIGIKDIFIWDFYSTLNILSRLNIQYWVKMILHGPKAPQ